MTPQELTDFEKRWLPRRTWGEGVKADVFLLIDALKAAQEEIRTLRVAAASVIRDWTFSRNPHDAIMDLHDLMETSTLTDSVAGDMVPPDE